jgi:hypothetical protein
MTEYSRWFNIRGKLSNREYSEIKNTVMFSTFTVVKWQLRTNQTENYDYALTLNL